MQFQCRETPQKYSKNTANYKKMLCELRQPRKACGPHAGQACSAYVTLALLVFRAVCVFSHSSFEKLPAFFYC